ncbi:DUF1003 domain-containing protein [Subtercola sp. RTI3]|uniref:DUF1003 domain-containing protein n=1 Tax=Subtercola sp. RTI3 TaxID=3048639 RepID=UPI002B23CFF2|nr:DUF1003 domain-containing protein [Subtercola sp. RTI3]MEA9985144.1 DUF1003 domain-containing protein [Subtercola sp. RTI3]
MPTTTAPPQPTARRRRSLRPSKIVEDSNPQTTHPAVLHQAEIRAASIQLRIADAITAFAGSMNFVYLHVVLFAAWMLFFEASPWPTLTLIVSLEAIFLSTFVMIGQNRQAAFQQAKADRDYSTTEQMLVENTDVTKLIHALTKEIRAAVIAEFEAGTQTPGNDDDQRVGRSPGQPTDGPKRGV